MNIGQFVLFWMFFEKFCQGPPGETEVVGDYWEDRGESLEFSNGPLASLECNVNRFVQVRDIKAFVQGLNDFAELLRRKTPGVILGIDDDPKDLSDLEPDKGLETAGICRFDAEPQFCQNVSSNGKG